MIPRIAILAALCIHAYADDLVLKTATNHPMQYYLSLPQGWTAQKKWPVVVVIDSANREFEAPARLFMQARGSMPFVIVVPMVISNGGARYRQGPGYKYSDAAWAQIEQANGCRVDQDGITAVMADVQKQYGGEPKYFLTGLEAAGHTIFPIVFQHPETLRAAAPVSPNYQGRCVEDSTFSTSPARADLPVRVYGGGADGYWKQGTPFYGQTALAKQAAESHGFKNVSDTVVPGKGHEFLAAEVLAYFYDLWKR